MKPTIKMVIGGIIIFIFLGGTLGLSFIFLPRGYFEIVLVGLFILGGGLEYLLVKKHGGKKADKKPR